MAIRHRPDRPSPWQCYWTNPITGKRESESFLTQQEAKKHDSLIKHRIKFERESFKKGEDEPSDMVTLEAAYLMYLREKKFSKTSLARQLDAMKIALKTLGRKPVSEITMQDCSRILDLQIQSGVRMTTARLRLTILRAVLRWCLDHGFIDDLSFPKMPTAHCEKFVPPTPAELRAIMEAATPHIQRVCILGAQCGVRVGQSELLKLTWDDVDLDTQILRVRAARKNPNAPWREVPIRDNLLPIFQRWKQEDQQSGMHRLIHYHGKPVESIKLAWRLTLERAGITRRIRPYDLRHAFATDLIAAGADIGTVATLMGHSNPMMVLKHYQYVKDEQKKAAIEALPDIQFVPKKRAQRTRKKCAPVTG